MNTNLEKENIILKEKNKVLPLRLPSLLSQLQLLSENLKEIHLDV